MSLSWRGSVSSTPQHLRYPGSTVPIPHEEILLLWQSEPSPFPSQWDSSYCFSQARLLLEGFHSTGKGSSLHAECSSQLPSNSSFLCSSSSWKHSASVMLQQWEVLRDDLPRIPSLWDAQRHNNTYPQVTCLLSTRITTIALIECSLSSLKTTLWC